jgi:hypothetical protein
LTLKNPIPEDLRSSHLFLLIGTNPVPNWVATRLLLADNGQLYLVHSDDVQSVAQRLARYLVNNPKYLPPIYVRVANPYKADDVYEAIKKKLKNITHGSVGLNYTGGTKVMATHSHRAAKAELPVGLAPVTFSYLEASTCTMRFDTRQEFAVGLVENCSLSLVELFKLHEEYLVGTPTKKVRAEPVLDLMVGLHLDHQQRQKWRNLCEDHLRYEWVRPTNRPRKKRGDILNEADAADVPLNFAGQFSRITDALSPTGSSGSLTLGDLAQNNSHGFKTAEEIAEWLDGKWLEHYVLKFLNERQAQYRLHDFGRNIDANLERKESTRRDKFEADVAAMRGYQLHLISCYSGADKSRCKQKLFEVFTRARQLGGDESRAALVCSFDDPRAIELEVGEVWDMKGRIKVFGKRDLLSLGDRLQGWFDSGAKEWTMTSSR